MEHKLAWTMNLSNQVLERLFQQTQEAMAAFTDSVGGFDQSDQLLVQYAYGLDPEPLGLAHIFKRVPYANPDVYRQHLEGAVERGWLTCEGEGAYGLAEKGEIYVDALMTLAEEINTGLAARLGFSEESMDHILDILDLMDIGIAEQEGVAEKHAWKMAHLFDDEAADPLYRLRRRLIYLLSYRDDAHIAVWAQHALDGYVWEAFSRVWEKQATDASSLAELLSSRFYDETDYQKALDTLVKLRWMDVTDEGYVLTGKGMALRENAEVLTNQAYDAAFETMSLHDLVELECLLETLVEALKFELVLV